MQRSLKTQLRPVPVYDGERLRASNIPARITASGRVSQVDRDINSFAMKTCQIISGCARPTHSTIRGILGHNRLWRNPAQRMPCRNSIITVTGDILTVDLGMPIVALDDITYLLRPCMIRFIAPSPESAQETYGSFNDVD